MKVILSCLLLFLAAVAQAISATGDRLLTVWEDKDDQKLYSKFLADLAGMSQSNNHPSFHSIANQSALKTEATRSHMPLPRTPK